MVDVTKSSKTNNDMANVMVTNDDGGQSPAAGVAIVGATGFAVAVSAAGAMSIASSASVVEDVAAAADPSGSPLVAVRRDTLSTSEVSADGDYIALKANSRGQLHVDASGGVASGSTDSGNPVKIGGRYNSTLPTLTDGQRGDANLTAKGDLRVGITDMVGASVNFLADNADAIAATSGATRMPIVARPYIYNGATYDRQKKPNSTNRIVSSAATTNATSIKASAGDVFGIVAMNTTASVKFLKLYNKASAPTVGTDTPVLTIPLPPSNAPYVQSLASPLYFSTGIAMALTGAAADADTTALASGDVVGLNILYQ